MFVKITLKRTDGYAGSIHLVMIALFFAGVIADPAQKPHERGLFVDLLRRPFQVPPVDKLDIALGIDPQRAGMAAGRLLQPQVVQRTALHAGTAADTFAGIDADIV